MIKFVTPIKTKPYILFKKKYDQAMDAEQKSIQAISISSYNINKHEVDARHVNLKFILNEEFIFFSNYNSPKAHSFDLHKQITALIYWPNVNVQIRMKANIKKTSNAFNQKYFAQRSKEKNALAISSNQSKPIKSYSEVKKRFNKSLKNDDLDKCPEYWGGFSFTPYYFEFWEGHESRLNKREVYEKTDGDWSKSFLQP